MRHNALRETEAKLKDVKEPELIPTAAYVVGNRAEKARLGGSAIGVWSQ